MSWFWDFVLIAGGYVLAVFTWTRIHAAIIGVEAKAAALRDQARSLTAKL